MGSRYQFTAHQGHQDRLQIEQFPRPTRPIHSFDADCADHRSSRWSPEDGAGERGGKLEAFEELMVNTISELIEKIPQKVKEQEMKLRGSIPAVRSRGLSEEGSEEIRVERFKVRTVELGEGDVKDVEDNKKDEKKK